MPATRTAASRRPAKPRSLACRECRDRKIRCDGTRPVCDSCVRRGLGPAACKYPDVETEGSIASSRSHILALQKRIKQLEADQRENARLMYASPPTQPVSLASPVPRGETWAQGYEVSRTLSPQSSPEAALQLVRLHQSTANWSSVHEAAPDYSYSTMLAGASPPLTDDLDDSASGHSYQAAYQRLPGRIALPPMHVMDDLLQHYFDLDWILVPLIHRPSFIQRYHRLLHITRTRETSTRDLDADVFATYCLLFGMLALGQLSKSSATEQAAMAPDGSDFHDPVRSLLVFDLVARPSMVAVQALILHARFLGERGCANEGWVFSGLALQLAQRLQLHLDGAGQTQAEHEERRRTWCACISIMRMGDQVEKTGLPGLSFGRFPQEIDDEYLDDRQPGVEGAQPAGLPSVVSFYVHSLKLSQNILDPIETFYFRKNPKLADIFATTARLDCELQEWHDELPQHLTQGAGKHFRLSRQAALMRIRYLEAKALLYRVAITSLIKQTFIPEGVSMTALTKSLTVSILDSHYATSSELLDLFEQDSIPIPRSHSMASICMMGVTFSMLQKQPILADANLNPLVYERELRRCVTMADRCTLRVKPPVLKYIEALKRLASRDLFAERGLVDPGLALDACTRFTRSAAASPPFCHAADAEAESTRTEVELLDVWYRELLCSYG